MSPAYHYKKMENRITDKLVRLLKGVGKGFASFFRNIYIRGKQRFTVMFIPHTEKKIFNFQISVFTMLFLILMLTTVLGTFFWLSTRFSGISNMLTMKNESLESTEANLEVLREEIGELEKAVKVFKGSLSQTMGVLGIKESQSSNSKFSSGDLSEFMGIEGEGGGSLKELSELQSLRVYLESAVQPLEEIGEVLQSQQDLLVDIPSLWPLKGVRGRITNYFGPSEHPFTGQWYLHKGIDIAYGYGVPIMATANGEVADVDFDPFGYGNYVLIKHKYGFYTRYAHIQRSFVKKGDQVSRGKVIATMGSSGLSTGPHLHYEVRIGSQIVDPTKYLNISNELLKVANRNN